MMCLPLGFSARSARAEVPGDFAAAMGLSTADGSVRTQTSVRMSLSPLPGPDFVMVMSEPVQARLGEIRACFAAAMATNPRAQGRVVLQVEAAGRGKAKALVTLDETGDAKVAECMRTALSRTDLRKVKSTRAGVLVAVDLTNPAARMHETMGLRSGGETVQVRTLSGGRVQSEGGTFTGEVRFELATSAFARPALEKLHRDLTARLAGLLDCRRKATKRGMKGEGAIELGLSLDQGRAARTKTVRSELTDRSAPQCVSAWIGKSVSSQVTADGPAEMALTVHFAR